MNFSHLKTLPPIDYRIPEWQPFPTEQRACPFCGTDSRPLFLRPDKLPVSQCRRCRCFYVAVKLSYDVLQRFYDQYWEVTCPRPLTDEMAMYLISSASRRFKNDHSIQKLNTLAGGLQAKRVLDIGCGFGEKAVIFKSLGATVTGLDIAPDVVAFMSEKLGVEAYHTTVEEFEGDKAHYDIVTMFEFIEHPLDPMAAMNAALTRIRTGGLIAIVTPNGTAGEGSISSKGNKWVGFQTDLEHMQYLHVDTIDYLARALRCRIVHLEQYGFRPLDDVLTVPCSHKQFGVPPPVRRFLKRIPGMRRAIYALHDLTSLANAINQPLRDAGDYHLFAVLQKIA